MAPLAVALLLWQALPASGQLGRQRETAGISWTPSLALRAVGPDRNVYVEPGAGQADRTAIFTPSATAKMTTRLLTIEGNGQLDYLYFEKFTQERYLNRKVNGRMQVDFGRFSPFVRGMFERSRDRQADIDIRIGRKVYNYGGGVALPLTAKGSIEASLTQGRNDFEKGRTFREIELAQSLNRKTENLNLGFRYALTPLTTLALDASRIREDYDSSPVLNTDDRRFSLSLFFAPDAILKGRFTIGYHRMRAQFPGNTPFRGLLADANLAYTFRESSRFNVRYFRDTSASFDSPFNVQTSYGIDLVQDIAGPLKVTAGASRQITKHAENVFVRQIPRNERYDSYSLGLAFYWSTSVRSTVVYDVQRRLSSIAIENFRRRRLLASLALVL